MPMLRSLGVGLLVAGVLVGACSGSNNVGVGPAPGVEAGADGGQPPVESGSGGGPDATSSDAGADVDDGGGGDATAKDAGGACTSGQTEAVACGKCGIETRTCTANGTWHDGPCDGQGVCTPGSAQACNTYGTQTCSPTCGWNTCSCASAAQCTPGDTCPSACSILTCDACGQWPGACGMPCSTTLAYTGGPQSFVVPAGVTQVTITAYGAQGGTDCYQFTGGLGASVTATIAVTPGETLDVEVGGMGGSPSGTSYCTTAGAGGYNGGGTAGAATY